MEFEYKCATSVAPQLLETGTVTVSYKSTNKNDTFAPELFQMRPHMIVLNDRRDRYQGFHTFLKTAKRINQDQVSLAGISLETIHDGDMAMNNQQSTAKTAIAVGGVVSVAVDTSATASTFPIGGKLVWNRPNGYAKTKMLGSELYVPVPTVGEPDERDTFGIGTIVDNSEIDTERYVRVRLF